MRVRRLLDVADDPNVRGSLMSALSRLTFVAAFDSRRVAEWDAWYEQHRDATLTRAVCASRSNLPEGSSRGNSQNAALREAGGCLPRGRPTRSR
jgi:hypothetical protein